MEKVNYRIIHSILFPDKINNLFVRLDRPNLVKIGTAVQEGWKNAAAKARLNIEVEGLPPISHFSFQDSNSQAMMTLFVQEMLKKGFLASNRFYASYAHQMELVESYLCAVKDVFQFLSKAQEHCNIDKNIIGNVAKPGFHRIT